jgi:RHS repeat-associated protein
VITSLGYNNDGRLATINPGKKTLLASYTYDGFGQRLLKTVSSAYGRIYQYGQDGLLLEETDASGVAQADYIYLDGRPIATLNPSTGALYFLHDDMLGTPQLATDTSQNLAWQATYQPFGQASVSGLITQNLRLPGQYFDLESGWNHNGFRNYLPDLGRYAEPDPLGIQGSSRYYNPALARFLTEGPLAPESHPNLYAYVVDDPIDLTDPFGLRPLTDCEKQVLHPFIPKIDLDNANLHDGQVPWYLGKDYEGITRGNDIYFRQGVYDPSTIDGLATLGHELVHVGQYRNGMTWAKYLWASRQGYDKNPYEKPAYDKEAEIKAALAKENCQGCKN